MRKPTFLSLLFLGIIGFDYVIKAPSALNLEDDTPNILFIAVDDLRPELGCYGKSKIYSPHIDQLAASGTLFWNSYCNIPVCGASRASILTGLRPTLTRFKRYTSRADTEAPEAITLPGLLKRNGYTTISNGKVFHNPNDSKQDWTEVWRPKGRYSPHDYANGSNVELDKVPDQRGRAYEMAEVPDSFYRDGQIALKSIADLKRLKVEAQPFFLAVGFNKPHLPFNAPKKYWDLYNRDTIALPTNRKRPTNVPKQALHNFGELRHYTGVPDEGQVSDTMAISLIHGYYACLSYTDALIGQVLDALDDLGLAENTIVVLWGDHGWNLMEHGLWCKHSNFRTSLKAPLIIRTSTQARPLVRKEMVEFVDVYPTLVELCGLELPNHLQGNSLAPLIHNKPVQWKTTVESVWWNGFTYTSQSQAYTEWRTETDSVVARMLFDHVRDPDENVNLIEE